MRLTKKSEKITLGYEAIEELVKRKDASPLIAKLGQLEDIEEELGIDLITLFKALLNGIYYKDENNVIRFDKAIGYQEQLNQLKQNMSLYGKTWALTKEELE